MFLSLVLSMLSMLLLFFELLWFEADTSGGRESSSDLVSWRTDCRSEVMEMERFFVFLGFLERSREREGEKKTTNSNVTRLTK